jgi:immune inhibitor A
VIRNQSPIRDGRCLVPAHPDLRRRLREGLSNLRTAAGDSMLANLLTFREPRRPGLNDGLIIPGTSYAVGTPLAVVRTEALRRAPLRETVRVVVVLVDFDDREMTRPSAEFEDLFFSTGVLPDGSVREYFTEVSNGLIEIAGEVVGPYRMPLSLADYAHGDSGTSTALPNARTMARDAALAADADVDFAPYDNDGNGFVDAFIVVHAGAEAAQTGDPGDIWAHKWVLSGGPLPADGVNIYGYLTVAEDCRIGVCCHELGHLLFGWPDLYDIDGSSEGLGNWCLMAGGSWNAGGDVPAHPSAWCKVNQQWVTVVNQAAEEDLDVEDVKDSHTVYRLWQDGAGGTEYFLMENRQPDRYDRELPGGGLLVYHIDDSMPDNSDESHYLVGLLQADGQEDLEGASNRGDGGDPYPGSAANRTFDAASSPDSHSHGGADTCVSITDIPDPGPVMTVHLRVSCAEAPPVETPMVRRGSRGEAVERLQRALRAAGFDPGPIDGIFGPLTEGAVRAYQASRGLSVDGIVGPDTWGALILEPGEV